MKLAWTEDLPSWTQMSKMTPSSSVELSSPVTRWTKLGRRPMPQGRVVTREVLGEAENKTCTSLERILGSNGS